MVRGTPEHEAQMGLERSTFIRRDSRPILRRATEGHEEADWPAGHDSVSSCSSGFPRPPRPGIRGAPHAW